MSPPASPGSRSTNGSQTPRCDGRRVSVEALPTARRSPGDAVPGGSGPSFARSLTDRWIGRTAASKPDYSPDGSPVAEILLDWGGTSRAQRHDFEGERT